MIYWFAASSNIQEITQSLRQEIKYHRKALDCCTKEFIYYRDIKTSLAESYAQLAHIYYKAFEFNDALNFYQKALENNYYHFQARNQIGLIYFQQKKFTNAIHIFEQIIYLASEPYELNHKIDAMLSLGLIYANLDMKGSINKAYKYVIEAERLAPNYHLTEKIMKEIMDIEKVKSKLQINLNSEKDQIDFNVTCVNT